MTTTEMEQLTEATIPVKTLRAAAEVASTDQARPLLCHVAIFSDDLVVATDSYRLVVIGKPDETPAGLILRVKERLPEPLFVPRDGIAKIAKLVKPSDHAATVNVKREQPEGYASPTVRLSTENGEITNWTTDGDYPVFAGLMSVEQPSGLQDPIALNADFVANDTKIAKLLAGRSTALLTCYGDHGHGKPFYMACRGDLATAVILQMPSRGGEICWANKSKKKEDK